MANTEGTDLNSVVARLDVEGAVLDADSVGVEDGVEVDVANDGGAEPPNASTSMEVEGAEKAPEAAGAEKEPDVAGAEKGPSKVRPPRARKDRRLGRGLPAGPPTPSGKKSLKIKARGRVLEMSGNFVWLSNLPFESTWKEVKDIIRKKVGGIRRCEIAEDANGKSLGFGVASFATEEFAKKCTEQMKDFELKGRKLGARELTKMDEERLARLCRGAAVDGTGRRAANGFAGKRSPNAERRSAPFSRSPAPYGRPPSLFSLGALAAASPFSAPPPMPPPMAMAPPRAEYGGAGGPAPLERVLTALRQERVLSETQLADLGLSAAALKSFGIEFDRYLTNQVFVSNLSYSVNYHDVRRAFSAAGRVERVKLPTTGTGEAERQTGYGIVTFENIYEAIQAIQMFNMKSMFDRTVKVRTYVPDELGFNRNRDRSEPEQRTSAFDRFSRSPAMGELVGAGAGPVLSYPPAASAAPAPTSYWQSSPPAPMREMQEQWSYSPRSTPAPYRAPAAAGAGQSMGSKAMAGADETPAIIVKNLPASFDEVAVQRTFRPIASALEVELLRDSMGRSMGVARVRFAAPADAIRVIRMMDGARIENAILSIQSE